MVFYDALPAYFSVFGDAFSAKRVCPAPRFSEYIFKGGIQRLGYKMEADMFLLLE